MGKKTWFWKGSQSTSTSKKKFFAYLILNVNHIFQISAIKKIENNTKMKWSKMTVKCGLQQFPADCWTISGQFNCKKVNYNNSVGQWQLITVGDHGRTKTSRFSSFFAPSGFTEDVNSWDTVIFASHCRFSL